MGKYVLYIPMWTYLLMIILAEFKFQRKGCKTSILLSIDSPILIGIYDYH